VSTLAGARPRDVVASARWHRLLALLRFLDARQKSLFGMRFARWSGAVIFLGYAASMLVLATSEAGAVADVLVVRALGWLSLLAGGAAALSAARDLAGLDAHQGILALLAQRGWSAASVEPARTAAAAYRISLVVAAPAMLLALLAVALSPGVAQIAPRLLSCVAVAAYSALLGVTLALLARWACALSPRHGRSIFLGFVLVPELVGGVLGEVPSIPGFFARLLDATLKIGAILP
jgi:hypothetical protein